MSEKGSRHRPWFPFYASDFASTVRRWSAEEIGCYVLLLIEQWNNDDVPLDIDQLARIHPDIAKHWQTKLKKKFPAGRNPRLEEIRADVNERSETNRRAALARWGKQNDDDDNSGNHSKRVQDISQDDVNDANAYPDADANAYANDDANGYAKGHAKRMRKGMLPTPTSTSTSKPKSKTKNKRPVITDSMWQTFIETYPKRAGAEQNKPVRDRAEKLIRSGVEWSAIMNGVRRYRDHCDATGTTGTQYVKMRMSFLSPTGRHWESEYEDAVDPEEQSKEQRDVDSLMSMKDILGLQQHPDESQPEFLDRLKKANDQRIRKLGT